MGCFDTIRGRCPHCDAEVKFQSKAVTLCTVEVDHGA